MLEFLISLLALVLSFGRIHGNAPSAEEITSHIETRVEHVSEPQSNPVVSENSASQDMVFTYNTKSENDIGEVAAVAVENAEPLVPYDGPTPTPSPDPIPTPEPGGPPIPLPIPVTVPTPEPPLPILEPPCGSEWPPKAGIEHPLNYYPCKVLH